MNIGYGLRVKALKESRVSHFERALKTMERQWIKDPIICDTCNTEHIYDCEDYELDCKEESLDLFKQRRK